MARRFPAIPLLLACGLALCGAPATGEEISGAPDAGEEISGAPAAGEQEPLRVLVVLVPTDGEAAESLARALAAHLSGYAIRIEPHPIERLPAARSDQLELARRVAAQEDGARGVIWLDATRASLILLPAPRDPLGAAVVRAAPQGDLGGLHADALSTIARSALTPWLAPAGPAPAAEAPVPDEAEPAPRFVPPEAPPGPKEPAAKRPPPRRSRVALLARAGYGFSISGNDRDPQHGARFAAGVRLGRHLDLEAGVDALAPIPTAAGGESDAELHRLPARLAATGRLSIGRVDLGLRVGLVVDFTRIEGIRASTLASDPDRVVPGLFTAAVAELRIVRFLSLFAEGGLDLFARGYDYTLADVTVLRYRPVQPLFSAGVTGRLAVR